jgi:predicted phage terminase large subunit-like protein
VKSVAAKSRRRQLPKATRWEPWESQLEAGNVRLVKAKWNRDFIDEHCAAPQGRYKDQIDAAAGAFAKLVAKKAFFVSGGVKRERGVVRNTSTTLAAKL